MSFRNCISHIREMRKEHGCDEAFMYKSCAWHLGFETEELRENAIEQYGHLEEQKYHEWKVYVQQKEVEHVVEQRKNEEAIVARFEAEERVKQLRARQEAETKKLLEGRVKLLNKELSTAEYMKEAKRNEWLVKLEEENAKLEKKKSWFSWLFGSSDKENAAPTPRRQKSSKTLAARPPANAAALAKMRDGPALPRCPACNKSINANAPREAFGERTFHRGCFTCGRCGGVAERASSSSTAFAYW